MAQIRKAIAVTNNKLKLEAKKPHNQVGNAGITHESTKEDSFINKRDQKTMEKVKNGKKPSKYNKKDIEEYIQNGNQKINELKE